MGEGKWSKWRTKIDSAKGMAELVDSLKRRCLGLKTTDSQGRGGLLEDRLEKGLGPLATSVKGGRERTDSNFNRREKTSPSSSSRETKETQRVLPGEGDESNSENSARYEKEEVP